MHRRAVSRIGRCNILPWRTRADHKWLHALWSRYKNVAADGFTLESSLRKPNLDFFFTKQFWKFKFELFETMKVLKQFFSVFIYSVVVSGLKLEFKTLSTVYLPYTYSPTPQYKLDKDAAEQMAYDANSKIIYSVGKCLISFLSRFSCKFELSSYFILTDSENFFIIIIH